MLLALMYMLVLEQVSPSSLGTHPQMQVNQSPNGAPLQVLKGMREDEVSFI